jgi:hypothetical protein
MRVTHEGKYTTCTLSECMCLKDDNEMDCSRFARPPACGSGAHINSCTDSPNSLKQFESKAWVIWLATHLAWNIGCACDRQLWRKWRLLQLGSTTWEVRIPNWHPPPSCPVEPIRHSFKRPGTQHVMQNSDCVQQEWHKLSDYAEVVGSGHGKR